jgi:hypothetical protein
MGIFIEISLMKPLSLIFRAAHVLTLSHRASLSRSLM